jgi:hypothetical protein
MILPVLSTTAYDVDAPDTGGRSEVGAEIAAPPAIAVGVVALDMPTFVPMPGANDRPRAEVAVPPATVNGRTPAAVGAFCGNPLPKIDGSVEKIPRLRGVVACPPIVGWRCIAVTCMEGKTLRHSCRAFGSCGMAHCMGHQQSKYLMQFSTHSSQLDC